MQVVKMGSMCYDKHNILWSHLQMTSILIDHHYVREHPQRDFYYITKCRQVAYWWKTKLTRHMLVIIPAWSKHSMKMSTNFVEGPKFVYLECRNDCIMLFDINLGLFQCCFKSSWPVPFPINIRFQKIRKGHRTEN